MSLFGRRRKLLIDNLQFTLLGVSMLHLTLIVGAFLVAIFAPAVLALYRETSPELSLDAATEFLNLHKRIWPAAGLALLLIVYHSVHVSHRIAGPLYRFRKLFALMACGDLSGRAGVRTKDYLRQDAEAINTMIDGLVERSSEIHDRTTAAHAALADLTAVVARSRDPELSAAVGRLGLSLDGMSESVGRLRIPTVEAVPVESPADGAVADTPDEVGVR